MICNFADLPAETSNEALHNGILSKIPRKGYDSTWVEAGTYGVINHESIACIKPNKSILDRCVILGNPNRTLD